MGRDDVAPVGAGPAVERVASDQRQAIDVAAFEDAGVPVGMHAKGGDHVPAPFGEALQDQLVAEVQLFQEREPTVAVAGQGAVAGSIGQRGSVDVPRAEGHGRAGGTGQDRPVDTEAGCL